MIRFEDRLDLRGQAITSDELYFDLGSYPYPLPSNAIQNMSFCTLTPGEVDLLLTKMKESPENIFRESKETITLQREPMPYRPEFDISKLQEATSESHLEAAVLANPNLFPEQLRPSENAVLCRQVPISPFKPSQMDRADITYYTDEPISNGTIPNTIIELKHRRAGKNEALQVVRYVKWLEKIAPTDFERISINLFAPSFTRNIRDHIPREYSTHIKLVPFKQTASLLEDF
jgi:RecB family endonuclease NucS